MTSCDTTLAATGLPAASVHSLYPMPPTESWVAETAPPPPPTVPEKLLHCLWYEARWRPTVLHTLEGTTITVHSPGRWNLHPGPDFCQAVLTFGNGVRQRGDVEIHRYASGWTAHQHHLDARYNEVILHVFLWHDRPSMAVTRADGAHVPQVALEPLLARPIEAYQADIPLEEYPRHAVPHQGHCYTAMRQLPLEAVQALLTRAGEQRLQQRMRRWAYRSRCVGAAQVLYEAVLRSLGSSGHRQHFQDLAHMLSWHEGQQCLRPIAVAEQGIAAEALVLGLAGIWSPDMPLQHRVDAATQHYVTMLRHYWDTFPASVRHRAWRHVNWRQPGVRPANTPERRLAGMAQLLAHYAHTTLLEVTLALCQEPCRTVQQARALCRALTNLLTLPPTSYWARRAHLGSCPGRTQLLIGAQRALTVVVDAILPVLLLQAQHHRDATLRTNVLACYGVAPRLPDNAVLRYMARCFCGNEPRLLAQVTHARHQQGLLQIFEDYCSNDEGDCQGCDFPLLTAITP